MTDRRTPARITAMVFAVLAMSAVASAQTVDSTFDPGTNGSVWAVALQRDGKILVGGEFTTIGGGGTGSTPRNSIARLNADGSVDLTFNPGADRVVRALAVQPDGKILVGGDFYSIGGMPGRRLARLNPDGSRDPTFKADADDQVHTIVIQPDGKILVGGEFRSIDARHWSGGTDRAGIARLNADSSLDFNFHPGMLFNPDGMPAYTNVRAIVIQPDGKIVVGGSFEYFSSIPGGQPAPRMSIARVGSYGSLDTSFDPGVQGTVYSLALQANGEILVGGNFTKLGGGATVPRNSLGRLHTDGTIDASFDPGIGCCLVSGITVQTNGDIVLAGSFAWMEGGAATRHNIGRMYADGAADTTFDPGTNGPIRAFLALSDGRILLGGDFTTVGGGGTGTIPRSSLARLLLDGPGVAPSILAHPENRTVSFDEMVSFWALASGTPPPAVQWQVSTDDGAMWNDPTGATSTSYSFTATEADDGRRYRAVFSNNSGTAITQAAVLRVTLEPPVATVHPEGVTTKAGRTASFTAAATGVPMPSVQWQTSTDGGGTWANVAGATAWSYALTATAAVAGSRYRAVFSSTAGEVTSNAATLTVRSVSGSDFDGDATTDIAVYRRTTGFWYVGNDQWVQYGGPGYVPVAGDYNGDGTTDIAVYEPASGAWYVRGQFWTQFGEPGDIPVPGDYDGDGSTDLAVYRPSTGGWYVRDQLGIIGFGGPDYIPMVADYNGDGSTDIAVYRPSTGFWYVRNQFAIQFGAPGDVPVAADYNGDGKADLAVYQPSTGMWRVRNQFTVTYGAPGDLPVARDFDGDGDADIAVYRPSTGHWFVRNQFTLQFGDAMDVPVPGGPSMRVTVNGDYDADRVTELAVYTAATGLWRVRDGLTATFGDPSDTPVPADYNGDGSMDVAVYRPSTGMWDVREQFTVEFGAAGDIPVPGDYDGDGLAEVAVYRPSTGFWYFHSQPVVHFGDTGDIPVPGDYNGDGAADIAVYRPSTGYWYVRYLMAVQLGAPGMTPVPGDYNGDGLTDVAVFDTATATWHIRGYPAIVFGDPADTPVPGDYDGDGTTDIAVYRPSTGEWIVRNQFTLVFGDPGDVPVVRSGGIQ